MRSQQGLCSTSPSSISSRFTFSLLWLLLFAILLFSGKSQ
ncbi:hypothetical protein OESDEN_15954, partial [Oesophagostomum dentatum]